MYQTKDSVFVIGVGNEYRSDDAAGLRAAKRIRNLGFQGVEVIESDGNGMELMDLWSKRKHVILIDAVSSGSVPGTIHVLEGSKNYIPPDNFKFSTHSFGIQQALKLSANLSTLPKKLIIFGIEGANFAYGQFMTPCVERALVQVESLVNKEVIKIQSNIKEKSVNGQNY